MKSRLSPAVQLSSCRVLSAASRAPLARAARRTCGAHRTSGRAAGLQSLIRCHLLWFSWFDVIYFHQLRTNLPERFLLDRVNNHETACCVKICLGWAHNRGIFPDPRHIFQPRSRAKHIFQARSRALHIRILSIIIDIFYYTRETLSRWIWKDTKRATIVTENKPGLDR